MMTTMRRREKGSGYLSRKPRKDGRFAASYVGSDGKRHWLTARTKPLAREALNAALRDKAAGLFVAGPSQTVEQFLRDWLRHVPLRPRSLQRYEGVIRLHIVPAMGDVPLRKLTPQHIARLYAELAERGKSAHNIHAVLSGAMKQAVQWNLIARNPVAAVRSPKATKREMAFLAPDEARALLSAVRGDPLEALYVTALMTGMRLGELLGLQWRDVDLSKKSAVTVRHTLTRADKQWQLAEPKTAASRRTIPLAPNAVEALRSHYIAEAERLLGLGHRIGPESLVFTDRWGDPLNPWHLTERRWKPLLRREGLKIIRFHDIRHSTASLMLSDGVPLHVVSRMLGHSKPSVTLNSYAHLMPGDEEAAVARLQARVGGGA